jgi:hypothetical protein
MLNCFVETCAHLGYPLLNAPILDGRFSPDGLGFSIASYYGSVSLYGYGDKDLFMTTPIEQFYSKEFSEFEIDHNTFRVISLHTAQEMHLSQKGTLCSAKKQEYKKSLQDEEGDFDEAKYYQKFVEAVETKKHSSLQDNSQNTSLDCVIALKKHLKARLNEEIQKKLYKFNLDLYEKGKFGTISHFVGPEKIIGTFKEDKGLKRLTRGIQQNQAQNPNTNQVTLRPQINYQE